MTLSARSKLIARKIGNRIANLARDDTITAADLPSEDSAFLDIWESCRPYTMSSVQRGLSLFRAVRYLCQNKIAGDFVECGVWRGGSAMIVMATLRHFGVTDRRVVLFDTYRGMTEPSAADIDVNGRSAAEILARDGTRADGILCLASLDEVMRNVAKIGYPAQLVQFVVGDIRDPPPLKWSDLKYVLWHQGGSEHAKEEAHA